MYKNDISKEKITERIRKLKSNIRYHMTFVEKYKDEAYELTTYLREQDANIVTEYMLENDIDPETALILLKKHIIEKNIPVNDRIA